MSFPIDWNPPDRNRLHCKAVVEFFLDKEKLRKLDIALRGLLSSPEDREDMIHEAMIRALKNWESFDNNRELKPWITTIAMNLARDFVKNREPESCQSLVDLVPAKGTDAGNRLLYTELLARFDELLQGLPPHKEAVVRRVVNQARLGAELARGDLAVMAKELGISAGSFHSQLSQARKLLRQSELGKQFIE